MIAVLKTSLRVTGVALALACAGSPALAGDPVRASFERMLERAPAPADPVAASFARMFAHQPGQAPLQVPADAGTDPLIAAVVLPLLRANQFPAAGIGPVAGR